MTNDQVRCVVRGRVDALVDWWRDGSLVRLDIRWRYLKRNCKRRRQRQPCEMVVTEAWSVRIAAIPTIMEEVNVVDTNTCREEPGRLQIGRSGVTISKVGPEDAGTYTCR